MIVAGVGCRKGASAAEIEAAIAEALAQAGLDALGLIATPAFKRHEAGISEAASSRNVPLVLVPRVDLETAGERVMTHSDRVEALTGVPSVAEASALAAGGPNSRLLAPRVAVGPATCALADTGSAA